MSLSNTTNSALYQPRKYISICQKAVIIFSFRRADFAKGNKRFGVVTLSISRSQYSCSIFEVAKELAFYNDPRYEILARTVLTISISLPHPQN